MRAIPAVVALSLLPACKDNTVTWERMLEQPRVNPYEYTMLFGDGRSMRLPPPGTIPHGLNDYELMTDAAAADAAIPIERTAATLAEGRRQYGIHCAPCHGTNGDGRSVVAQFMTLRAPTSLVVPPVSDYPPGRIFAQITHGLGYMRSYQEIEIADRWAIVLHVQSLPPPQPAPQGANP